MTPGAVTNTEDLTTWGDRLEGVIERARLSSIDRVAVLAETDTTMRAAREMSGGMPGLAVVASRQTAGKARLGRSWTQAHDLGVAVTFAVDGRAHDDAHLSIASGVAACRTVEAALGVRAPLRERLRSDGGGWIVPALLFGWFNTLVAHVRADFARPAAAGVRWPNDVVEGGRNGRKYAGILVERSGDLALVGIGINVLQRDADWDDDLLTRAVSLAQRGSEWSRIEVLERLFVELDAALATPTKELLDAWRARDVLAGSVRTFEHDGGRVTGRVVTLDPRGMILLRTDSGAVRLPAATASLVHGV